MCFCAPRSVFWSCFSSPSSAVTTAIAGVIATAKHFPGHGMVFADSHRTIPTADLTYDQWRTTHALPFIAGIDAGVELVMTGHIRVPAVSKDPASVSDDWISILREDLGFDGIIITDDLRTLFHLFQTWIRGLVVWSMIHQSAYRDRSRNMFSEQT